MQRNRNELVLKMKIPTRIKDHNAYVKSEKITLEPVITNGTLCNLSNWSQEFLELPGEVDKKGLRVPLRLTSEHLDEVALLLQSYPQIEVLNLDNNAITKLSEPFLKAIAQHQCLKEVQLNGNVGWYWDVKNETSDVSVRGLDNGPVIENREYLFEEKSKDYLTESDIEKVNNILALKKAKKELINILDNESKHFLLSPEDKRNAIEQVPQLVETIKSIAEASLLQYFSEDFQLKLCDAMQKAEPLCEFNRQYQKALQKQNNIEYIHLSSEFFKNDDHLQKAMLVAIRKKQPRIISLENDDVGPFCKMLEQNGPSFGQDAIVQVYADLTDDKWRQLITTIRNQKIKLRAVFALGKSIPEELKTDQQIPITLFGDSITLNQLQDVAYLCNRTTKIILKNQEFAFTQDIMRELTEFEEKLNANLTDQEKKALIEKISSSQNGLLIELIKQDPSIKEKITDIFMSHINQLENEDKYQEIKKLCHSPLIKMLSITPEVQAEIKSKFDLICDFQTTLQEKKFKEAEKIIDKINLLPSPQKEKMLHTCYAQAINQTGATGKNGREMLSLFLKCKDPEQIEKIDTLLGIIMGRFETEHSYFEMWTKLLDHPEYSQRQTQIARKCLTLLWRGIDKKDQARIKQFNHDLEHLSLDQIYLELLTIFSSEHHPVLSKELAKVVRHMNAGNGTAFWDPENHVEKAIEIVKTYIGKEVQSIIINNETRWLLKKDNDKLLEHYRQLSLLAVENIIDSDLSQSGRLTNSYRSREKLLEEIKGAQDIGKLHEVVSELKAKCTHKRIIGSTDRRAQHALETLVDSMGKLLMPYSSAESCEKLTEAMKLFQDREKNKNSIILLKKKLSMIISYPDEAVIELQNALIQLEKDIQNGKVLEDAVNQKVKELDENLTKAIQRERVPPVDYQGVKYPYLPVVEQDAVAPQLPEYPYPYAQQLRETKLSNLSLFAQQVQAEPQPQPQPVPSAPPLEENSYQQANTTNSTAVGGLFGSNNSSPVFPPVPEGGSVDEYFNQQLQQLPKPEKEIRGPSKRLTDLP